MVSTGGKGLPSAADVLGARVDTEWWFESELLLGDGGLVVNKVGVVQGEFVDNLTEDEVEACKGAEHDVVKVLQLDCPREGGESSKWLKQP